MNGQVERYSRVSVTRADGVVTHADITHVQVRFAVSPAPDAECAETPGAANGAVSGGCHAPAVPASRRRVKPPMHPPYPRATASIRIPAATSGKRR